MASKSEFTSVFMKTIMEDLKCQRYPIEQLKILLRYPLDVGKLSVETTDDDICAYYDQYLPLILNSLFDAYCNNRRNELLTLVSDAALSTKPDVYLNCIAGLLSICTGSDNREYAMFLASQLERFLCSSDQFFSLVSICACNPLLTDFCSRSVVSVHCLVSNALKGIGSSILLDKDSYASRILSYLKDSRAKDEHCLNFFSMLVGQFCTRGLSSSVSKCIFRDLDSPYDLRYSWSKIFLRVKETCLENCVEPVLTNASHPDIIAPLFFISFQNPTTKRMNDLFQLFRRLIFVRYFTDGLILRNIFGVLGRIVVHDSISEKVELIDRVDKELGLPLLRVWSDASAVHRNSVEQRLYISQALASWLTDFKLFTGSSFPSDYLNSTILPDVLNGISNHLASPRCEIRTIGMSVGEWLTQQLPLASVEGDRTLKFTYEETAATKAVKPFFTPLPKLGEMTAVNVVDDSPTRACTQIVTETNQLSEDDLDSDDDPDVADGNNNPLNPLPRMNASRRQAGHVLSSVQKPRYLRECLDGMLLSRSEDTFINLSCTAAAAELIRAHPQTARELAIDFARVLVHVEPPAAPDETKVDSDRHAALVALGAVAPHQCARYLTNEFCKSTCSVGQRMGILSVLTDVACELSMLDKRMFPSQADNTQLKINCSAPLSVISGRLHEKTRRFCKPTRPSSYSVNQFIPVAGDFFFPLLHSIPQLFTGSEKGVFAHQDAALLANLVAALATIYACAHLSPNQFRMAHELLNLSVTLYRHNEPAVRRATLVAIGTVITMTPTNVLSSHPELIFDWVNLSSHQPSLPQCSSSFGFVVDWLRLCSTEDADTECRMLASVGLSALLDRASELSKNRALHV